MAGQSRKQAILDRAVELASVDGLEGLTIGTLAGDLGLSKSGLFGHFGSKEDLQLATVDHAAQRFVRDVVEPAAGAEEGRPRLGALCEHYLDHLEARALPGGCFWAAAMAEFDTRLGPVHDAVRTAVSAWLAELERHARVAGYDDPAQLVFELQSLVQGANANYQLLGDPQAFSRARAAVEQRLG